MFALYFLCGYLVIQAHCEEIYSNKYDGVNLEEIFASERLLTGYVNCLLDKGSCTPDARELKKNIPDAINNNCKKCTNRQREGADQVMQYIIDHRPDDWMKLEQKYDADGSYKRNYFLSKHGKEEETTEHRDGEETNSKENNES